MTNVNIALEAFGIIVSLTILFGCYSEAERNQKTNIVLREMALLNIAVTFFDMMIEIFGNRPELELLLYILSFLVFSIGYLITAVFTYYLFLIISERTEASDLPLRWINIFCIAAICMAAISPFNHMFYYFENGVYYRGELFWLSQAFPIVLVLVDMVLVLRFRKSLGFNDTVALLCYGLLPVIALSVQIHFDGVVLLYPATALSLLIIYIFVHADQTRRLRAKENELTQMSVAVMLSQIQPHFLYNALNTIKILCEKDPKTAARTITNFARYLRGNMDSLGAKNPIPFGKELEHLECYLAIEKLRFPQIKVVYDLKAINFMLPSLTVQPITENSIHYGIGCREEGGTVTISSWEDEKNFYVSISDDGEGFDPEETQSDGRSHIGIDNTRSRLASMCGGTLVVSSVKGEGTKAEIIIPKEAKNEGNSC